MKKNKIYPFLVFLIWILLITYLIYYLLNPNKSLLSKILIISTYLLIKTYFLIKIISSNDSYLIKYTNINFLLFFFFSGWILILILFSRKSKLNSINNYNHKNYNTNDLVLDFVINQTDLLISSNGSCHYFNDTLQLFTDLINSIDHAKESINIEFYAIAIGWMWDQLVISLKKALERGVKIKIIYDQIGSKKKLLPDFNKINSCLFEVLPFNDFNKSIFQSLNKRTHKKLIIIDEKIAYLGGFNIGDQYLNITPPNNQPQLSSFKAKYPTGIWKDSGVKVISEVVSDYHRDFLLTWDYLLKKGYQSHPLLLNNLYKNEKIKMIKRLKTDYYLVAITDPINQNHRLSRTYQSYLTLINSARQSIDFTTPYLILDDVMLTSLILASNRGVRIRIITPGIPDKKIIYKLTQSHYQRLLEQSIMIYQYDPGFIHAKNLIIDSIYGVTGSVNLDIRSFNYLYESIIIIKQPLVVKTMLDDFNETLKVSTPITLDNLPKFKLIDYLLISTLNLIISLI